MQTQNVKSHLNFLTSTVLSLGVAALASALNPVYAFTVTQGGRAVAGEGQFSNLDGVTTIDFNNGVASTTGFAVYSAPDPGASIVSGSLSGFYLAPEDNNTKYLTIAPFSNELGNSPVTINFAKSLDYFGLHWGSLGYSNSLAFYRGNTLIKAFSDLDVASLIGVLPGEDAGYVNFFANRGESFDKVILKSTGIAFESDNHAYRVAADVPEPGTALGLTLVSFFGMGSLLKRKSRSFFNPQE